jgi:N6-L-threonylcarbamoyladenine synthase
VVDVLADRVRHAIAMAPQCRLLVVAGGVAANGAIRAALASVATEHGLALSAPPLRLCGDNAVMVAWAAIERLRIGVVDGLETAPRPRWPLGELAA